MGNDTVEIKGYEGLYSIDKSGNVFCKSKGKRNPTLASHGYLTIRLLKDGKYKGFYIHRLLSIAFIPNPNNLPCVNHLDGNKLNNSISNLEWCTYKENSIHAVKTGLSNPKFHITSRSEAKRRMSLKGRKVSEETKELIRKANVGKIQNNSAHKLNFEIAQEIRKKYSVGDVTHKELGDMYGVSRSVITNLIGGRIWTHGI